MDASPNAAAPRRALCVAPHPDDELLGCGGTLALWRARGCAVRIVVAFDGALGGDPRARRAEALRGGALLDLDDYCFLDHPEGHEPGPGELEAGALELARAWDAFDPEVVLVPWDGEEHVDHRSVARAAQRALEWTRARPRLLHYEVHTPLAPDRLVDVGAVFARKLAALAEHATQMAATDLRAWAERNARRRGAQCRPEVEFAEAFAQPRHPGRGAQPGPGIAP